MASDEGIGGRVLRKLLRKALGELKILGARVDLLTAGHASRARQDATRMAELERRVDALEALAEASMWGGMG